MLKKVDRPLFSGRSRGHSITTTIDTRKEGDPSETVGLSLTHAVGTYVSPCTDTRSAARNGIGFKQVLVATDFSDGSQRALFYAIAIARRYGSALSVVHAIPPEPRDQIPLGPLPRELNRRRLEAEEEMKHLGEKVQMKDLDHSLLLEQGPVWDVLASVIQREKADLLVLGTRGRGGLKKLALGSVAERSCTWRRVRYLPWVRMWRLQTRRLWSSRRFSSQLISEQPPPRLSPMLYP